MNVTPPLLPSAPSLNSLESYGSGQVAAAASAMARLRFHPGAGWVEVMLEVRGGGRGRGGGGQGVVQGGRREVGREGGGGSLPECEGEGQGRGYNREHCTGTEYRATPMHAHISATVFHG